MKVNLSLLKTPKPLQVHRGGSTYDPMDHEHLMYLHPKPTPCIKGLFTPWTMKSPQRQGLIKFVIGC
jgi:hypothetical protein